MVFMGYDGVTSLEKRDYRSSLTRLLCGLYALLLVVFGVVFAVASSLSAPYVQRLDCLEVFLLYLYLGALVTLVYLQLCVLRGNQTNRNSSRNNSIRIIIRRRSQDNLHFSPLVIPRENYESTTTPTVPPPSPDQKLPTDQGFEPRKEPLHYRQSILSYASGFRSNASDFRSHGSGFRSLLVLPPDGQVAHVGEGINFYLRLGALGFSLGSVTMDGFHVASHLHSLAGTASTCCSPLFLPLHLAHLLFTFFQTFFLFKNHKVLINKQKAAVRLALMHLLAANLCVWVVTVVTDTAENYHHRQHHSPPPPDFAGNSTPSSPPSLKSCYASGEPTLARAAAPYLFPCTVIYSLMAAGIVYRMYTNVGVSIRQRWPSHTSFTSSAAPQGAASMDCEKAHKGLFSGLLVAVVTLIAIATFFVLDTRLNRPGTAVKVFFILEMSLLLLTGAGLLTGLKQLRRLRYRFTKSVADSAPRPSLDAVLLLVTLAGVYLYLGFGLVSSASSLTAELGLLSLLSVLVELLESTLQAIFVLQGLCRRAESDSQVESKPGRAAVTFVLVCNLALWVLTLFETRKTLLLPFHLAYYGPLPWNLILHLCVPLYVYFRFHSAICLSKIWYHAYTKGD